jgi:YVTN family beta-propeller protein
LQPNQNSIPGGNYLIQLSPRLAQEARLTNDWISAHDDSVSQSLNADSSPVYGWLLPHYLDQGLQVYDPAGVRLGELRKGKGTPIWEPAPYSPYAKLADLRDSHPQLASMLTGLQTAANYQAFLTLIDESLLNKPFSSARYLRSLSACIGRPLALVRARWQLELAQPPYADQSWGNTERLLDQLGQLAQLPAPSLSFEAASAAIPADFTQFLFSVRLGNPNVCNDGLIGYFQAADYQTFFAVCPSPAISVDPTYFKIIKGQELQLSCQPGQFAMTSLLLDPAAPVHAYTDILPVYTVTLPERFLTQAMQQIEVSFRIGPVLSLKYDLPLSGNATPSTSQLTIRLPKPAFGKEWSWLERHAMTGTPTDWQLFQVQPVDLAALLDPEPYDLVDGWFILRKAFSKAATLATGRLLVDRDALVQPIDPIVHDVSATEPMGNQPMLSQTVSAPVVPTPRHFMKKGVFMPTSLKLTYGIATDPMPLQASDPAFPLRKAAVNIIISNNTDQSIFLEKLVLQLPLGAVGDSYANHPATLTDNPSGIQFNLAPDNQQDWTITFNQGLITLTPRTGQRIEVTTKAIGIYLANMDMNQAIGNCEISVIETTAERSEQDATAFIPHSQTGSIVVTKSHPTFSLRDFKADKLTFISGDPINLTWWVNPVSGMTLKLFYNPDHLDANNGIDITQMNIPGTNDYRYPVVEALMENPIFTLNAEVRTQGDLRTYTYQYMALAQVSSIKRFSLAEKPPIAFDTTITLSWQTDYIDHCKLSANGQWVDQSLLANGSLSFKLKESTSYTLYGYRQTIPNTAIVQSTLEISVFHPAGSLRDTFFPYSITRDASKVYLYSPAAMVFSPNANKLYVVSDLDRERSTKVIDRDVTNSAFYYYTSENLYPTPIQLDVLRQTFPVSHPATPEQTFPVLVSHPATPDKLYMAGKSGVYQFNVSNNTVSRLFKPLSWNNPGLRASTRCIALRPDGSMVYVGGETTTTTHNIRRSDSVIQAYETRGVSHYTPGELPPTRGFPSLDRCRLGGLAVHPETFEIYVVDRDNSQVKIIKTDPRYLEYIFSSSARFLNFRDFKVVQLDANSNPFTVFINPTGNKAYVSIERNNSVAIIDCRNYAVTYCNVGVGPTRFLGHPKDHKLLVANSGSPSSISVIDTVTDQVIGQYPLDDDMTPISLAIDSADRKLFVASNEKIQILWAEDTVIPASNPPTVAGPIEPMAHLAKSSGTRRSLLAYASSTHESPVQPNEPQGSSPVSADTDTTDQSTQESYSFDRLMQGPRDKDKGKGKEKDPVAETDSSLASEISSSSSKPR